MALVENAILVVDLGNSSTEIRVVLPDASAESGYVRLSKEIRNRYTKANESLGFHHPNNEDNSWRFRLKGTHDGFMESEQGVYDGGQIVTREYTDTIIRPTALDPKYQSTPALLALNASFMWAFRLVSMYKKIDLADLEISWSLVEVLLPPASMGNESDTNSGIAKMTRMVKSIDSIDFIKPNINKEIKLERSNSVVVAAEGHVGCLGIMFDPNGVGVKRKGYEYLFSQNNLILDIGAGTTDVLQIIDSEPIASSRKTFIRGGNNIMLTLNDNMVRAGLPSKKDQALQNALITGKIKNGADVVSVVEHLEAAKATVATGLVNDLTQFFEATGIDISEIQNLVVIGGGAKPVLNEAGEVISKPISNFLVERIKQFAPNIQLVPLPKEQVSQLGGGTAVVEVDPRKLNVTGAVTLAILVDSSRK